MPIRHRATLAAVAALVFCTSLAAAVHAQTAASYPERTIRIVVPFPPGGATDILARLIAERLNARWGKPAVIENVSGAAGALGTAQAAKAPPDGYTLLTAVATTTTLLPHLRKLAYEPLRDFDAVALICSFPNLLVVRPEIAAANVKELIDLVRANPGKFSYASSGPGGSPHLSAEWFKAMTKTDILHVPYTGSGPALPALLGGHVDMMFDTIPSVWPLVAQGKLRALAVTTATRLPFLPDLPTIGETLPGYDLTSWLGIVVPAGTPSEIRAKLANELSAFLAEPATIKRLHDLKALPAGRHTPDEFAAHIRRDYEKWGRIVKETGIKLGN